MKNSIKTLAVLALVGFAGTAFAQNNASTTGTASGSLIAPITLVQTTPMTFGNAVAGVAGTIGTPGEGSLAGFSTGLNPGTQGGTQGDAVFTVGGNGNFTFAITTPATATVGGSATGVTSIALGSNATGALSGGSATFHVWGLATVTAASVAGNITGTWTEAVAYN